MEPIFNKQPAKPEFLRALLRAYTVYYGFLRFTDYCSIADENVQDMGTFIKIYIPKSKNDQVRIVTLLLMGITKITYLCLMVIGSRSEAYLIF